MTYNVFGGTLNLAQSLSSQRWDDKLAYQALRGHGTVIGAPQICFRFQRR